MGHSPYFGATFLGGPPSGRLAGRFPPGRLLHPGGRCGGSLCCAPERTAIPLQGRSFRESSPPMGPRLFWRGGGSFRFLPAIACSARAARGPSRTTRPSHPPPVSRYSRKDPRISLPVPCLRRSGNPQPLLLCRLILISGEFVRQTPVPSEVRPPRRSRLPAGRMLLGLLHLYRS